MARYNNRSKFFKRLQRYFRYRHVVNGRVTKVKGDKNGL